MGKLLLVTGSRALCDRREASDWAREVIRHEVARLAPGGLVVTGDASGPDCWATEAAIEYDVKLCRYELDGFIETRLPGGASRSHRWSARPDRSDPKWPLTRNRVMISAVAGRADRYDILVLGLRCSWAKTHGTEFTLRLAQEAGLPIQSLCCTGDP